MIRVAFIGIADSRYQRAMSKSFRVVNSVFLCLIRYLGKSCVARKFKDIAVNGASFGSPFGLRFYIHVWHKKPFLDRRDWRNMMLVFAEKFKMHKTKILLVWR